MLSIINSSNLIGINGYLIKIEIDITNGIPSFNIVGLASTEIKESRERVKSAVVNSGYKFKVVDQMFTNFHTPESTLIMLVSAFAGRENILNAYKIAVENNYRFFSYGDCMLIRWLS